MPSRRVAGATSATASPTRHKASMSPCSQATETPTSSSPIAVTTLTLTLTPTLTLTLTLTPTLPNPNPSPNPSPNPNPNQVTRRHRPCTAGRAMPTGRTWCA